MTSLPGLAQTSASTASRFFCGLYQGHPATVVRTISRGNIPLILWVAERISVQVMAGEPTRQTIGSAIDNSNPQPSPPLYFPGDDLLTPLSRRHGLPIGNLTSQLFANFYLTGFDHFVHETLKVSPYLRYVDDFCLFADDPNALADHRLALEAYLATLRLQIHPIKSQIFATQHGANFVGFRVFPTHIRVRSANLQMGRRRLRYNLKRYQHAQLNSEAFRHSLQSWLAHLSHADTWQLRHKILIFLIERLQPIPFPATVSDDWRNQRSWGAGLGRGSVGHPIITANLPLQYPYNTIIN